MTELVEITETHYLEAVVEFSWKDLQEILKKAAAATLINVSQAHKILARPASEVDYTVKIHENKGDCMSTAWSATLQISVDLSHDAP